MCDCDKGVEGGMGAVKAMEVSYARNKERGGCDWKCGEGWDDVIFSEWQDKRVRLGTRGSEVPKLPRYSRWEWEKQARGEGRELREGSETNGAKGPFPEPRVQCDTVIAYSIMITDHCYHSIHHTSHPPATLCHQIAIHPS